MPKLSAVKFQIVSDLHIEIEDENIDPLTFITPSADVLILAGDIGRIHKYDQLKGFLTKICKHFQIVLYVLGNHEYYRVGNLPAKTMEELFEDITCIKKEIPNLYILNRNSVIIEDVCIVGCTLWSQAIVDVPPFIVRVKNINIEKYNSMFRHDLCYIENMIDYCQQKSLKLVVVTHHCPTYSVAQNKKDDKYKSLYASNLDNLLSAQKVHTWICGHIHRNFDFYTKNSTHLVSNQKGKLKDKVIDFSKCKVITV